MSGGKKKSGFQITSVTSDYEQAGGGSPRKDTYTVESGGLFSPTSTSNHLINGGQGLGTSSPGLSSRSASPCPFINVERGTGFKVEHDSTGGTGQVDEVDIPNKQTLAFGGVERKSLGTEAVMAHLSVSSILPNGPSLQLPGSSLSTPSTPTLPRRQTSLTGTTSHSRSLLAPLSLSLQTSVGSVPQLSVASSSSRFRLVKLDQGPGEPYKRGRWTCVDFYDGDTENHAISKILDSMRHAHSMESLEVLGIGNSSNKPLTQFRTLKPSQPPHVVHSQGTTHLLVQNTALSLAKTPASGQQMTGTEAPAAFPQPASATQTAKRAPPNVLPIPSSESGPMIPEDNPHLSSKGAAPTNGSATASLISPPASLTKEQPSRPQTPSSKLVSPTSPRSLLLSVPTAEHGVAKPLAGMLPLHLDSDRGRKVVRHQSHSRPVSPSPLLVRERSPHRRSLDYSSPSPPHLSLSQSMLSTGTSLDSDDDSGSSSSMIAIDNKIEQAMDLVKSHLMYAVREEVEVLREQIKELIERNSLLERENSVLKSIASSEQLSQLQTQMKALTGTSGGPPPTSA
ncbi:TSC22 domain family protein 4-like [Erpetoichthys calabaricus]|uniref:TSC22 domain family protein 4-like n=1 Tax=Erpetoichthys calabaricus TaxID=27687 RepID=UPI0010A0A8E7|nr:TSC22 domain family protein 4-like [Erpetoichthys calabaricus]